MYFGHYPFKEPDKNNKDKEIKPLHYVILFLAVWLIISIIGE